jgi:hypothetical protein
MRSFSRFSESCFREGAYYCSVDKYPSLVFAGLFFGDKELEGALLD